ncbi:MAG: hypothetical protein ABS46_12055 [Cytophagaceae bacterium SCN 52-12]|nr:MAG: hypothetical protein ABS46_12055 [Cytophagaceae bacterium SCN 52-12]
MKVAQIFARGGAMKYAVLGFLICGRMSGQTLQVAQKTIHKNISSAGISKLVIGSEKADIEVHAWTKAEIKVTIELSASHSEKSVTLEDLEKVMLIADKEKKIFYLRDFVLLKGKDKKPESNLRARYKVYAPAGMSLDIDNSFGVVTLKDFNGEISLKTKFCRINMSRLSGKTNLITRFGNLEAFDLSGNLDLSSNHTQIILRQLSGKVRLSTEYGSLQLEPASKLVSLDLRSKKTTVDLVCPEWKKYSYAIKGAYSKFSLPAGFKTLSEADGNQELSYHSVREEALLKIETEFAHLSVRQ